MNKQAWIAAVITFFTLIIIVLVRQTGLHIDENNYLLWGATQPLGDSLASGKPFLFYYVNYLVFQLGGFFSLHVFYAALNSLALGFFIGRIGMSPQRFGVLVLSAPLFLLNGSQVMMESPLFVLGTVALSLVFTFQKLSLRGLWFLFGCCVFGILFKETAAPGFAVLALAAVIDSSKRKAAAVLGIGVLAGLMTSLSFQLFVGMPNHAYGGLGSFFQLEHLLSRMESTPRYLWTWAFYLGVPQLVYFAFKFFPKIRFRHALSTVDLLVLVSGLGTLLVQFASKQEFARYCYPVIWAGVLGMALVFRNASRRWYAAAIAWNLAMSSMLVVGSPPLLAWPSLVSTEIVHNGYTVFPQIPIYRWVLTAGEKKNNPCVLVYQKGSEKPWAMAQFMALATRQPQFFNEEGMDAFNTCVGPKIVLRRQFQQDPKFCEPCESNVFSKQYCVQQELKAWVGNPGVITNRVCLP